MSYDLISNLFVISKDKLNLEKFNINNTIALPHATVYYDDSIRVTHAKNANIEVVVLGYILDIRDSTKNELDIAQSLSDFLTKENESAFLDEIDYLNGRYVLIVSTKDDTRIFSDATCLRPIFFYDNHLFGSHEILLKDIVRSIYNTDLEKIYTVNGYMDVTNTSDIYKFNCNNYFSFLEESFSRYYPRKSNKVIPISEIVNLTKDYFHEQTKWLKNNFPIIYASITGGNDSKVTLSFLKNIIENVELFTFMIDFNEPRKEAIKKIYRLDKIIVDRLTNNFHLNHKYYNLNDYNIDDSFREAYNNNFSSKHSAQVATMFRKDFSPSGIHVKSNLYEMAKLPFLEKQYNFYKKDDLFSATLKWAPSPLREKTKIARAMFDGYLKRSNYHEVYKFGHNNLMMLYWESRNGNWHSNITQETDEHIETFIYVNNRFMLDLFMSLSIYARKGSRLLKAYVEDNWPFLNYQLPNSRDTLITASSDTVKLISQTELFEITFMKNVNVKPEGNGFLITPSYGTLLKDEPVKYMIRNISEKAQKVNIRSFYKHNKKNVFVFKNGKKFQIDDFFNGFETDLPLEDSILIEVDYTTDFESQTWNDAGRLLIEEIL